MGEVAIFSGRFQPPHLGHFLTLQRIMDDYDKIIIAITDYTYNNTKLPIMPIGRVKEILEETFKQFPKFEIVIAGKPFLKRTSFDDLPHFDVVVSANKKVVERMKEIGLKARFVERTPGYSGTDIRKFFKDNNYDTSTLDL